MKNSKTLNMVHAAVIAALYVILTFLSAAMGLGEVRLSEALCILPYFTPAAVPGLTVGCVLANLLTGCGPWDVIFGSVASLIGAFGTWLLRKKHWLFAPWPSVISNVIIVSTVLYLTAGGNTLLGWGIYIGISELVSCVVLGYILLMVIKKRPQILR